MKNLLLGILLIGTINAYSQEISIDMDVSLDLDHFEKFFKEDNPMVPLDTLIYHENKSFSPDKSLYIQTFPYEYKHLLMTNKGRYITKVPYTSFYDKIIWLKNCVVVDGRDNNIYLIDFKDYKRSAYYVKGGYSFIGNSDSLSYFYSFNDSTYVGDYLIPIEHTIFSINEKGINLTNKKEREDDNKIIRKYYNESFSFVKNKDTSGAFTYNFHYPDSIWTYDKPINFFNEWNVYHRNGSNYVEIIADNPMGIFRFDKNNVTPVIKCDTLNIKNFMVENDFLIYTINFHYQKPPLYLINIKTNETYHPVVIQKRD